MRCDNLAISDTIEYVSGKYEYEIDVAVLLIFFNRPGKIAKVFEQVKKARPSRLYLYQDGARPGRDDEQAINACREAVEGIDWNCTVHKLYQTENFGCDPSEYIAQKWMFSKEDQGIVLEDDDVPSLSFFRYCKELLDKYANDSRVAIICGMNNYDVTQVVEESYFFSKRGSIWGWASWKRFIDLWDPHYTWLESNTKGSIIRQYCDFDLDYEKIRKTNQRHRDSGREHYESIMFAAAALNNMLNIVPKYNMISNIGIDKESTHSVSDIRLLPKRTQRLLYKRTYEIQFPLIHPQDVVRNKAYDKKYVRTVFQKGWDRFEREYRKLFFLILPRFLKRK